MRDRVSFDISTDRLDEAVGRFPNLQVIAEGSVKRPDVQPTVVPPTMAQLLRVPPNSALGDMSSSQPSVCPPKDSGPAGDGEWGRLR